jgi:hypothetical protein
VPFRRTIIAAAACIAGFISRHVRHIAARRHAGQLVCLFFYKLKQDKFINRKTETRITPSSNFYG